LLNGANASGKSAFLEIVTLALFGDTVPSRMGTTSTLSAQTLADSLINQARPKGQISTTEFLISVNGAKYSLMRQFVGSNEGTIVPAKATTLRDELSGEIIARGPKLVKQWLDANVGSIETFLLTAMHTQHDDNNFFGLGSAAQTETLDRLFHMKPFQLFQVCFISLMARVSCWCV
jgi:DNA repair exonuclease SbcCD ATPase subunit